jgi:hypothetical protein
MAKYVPGILTKDLMIETKVKEPELPRFESIQGLFQSDGPRITILLPRYQPGAQGKSMTGLLKTYLRDLTHQLTTLKVAEPVIAGLLKPLQDLSEDEQSASGSRLGRVIFRSRDVFQQFDLLGPVAARFMLGAYFQIRPILSDLYLPPEFYVLKLSKKSVELRRCAHLRSQTVELPKGVPQTLDEALAFEPPDHDLENRSACGVSSGAMRGIRFGTGSGRESQPAHLADFYRIVDRGIVTLLHSGNPPLILAGVGEDTAAYRMINTYLNLLSHSIHGSPNQSLTEPDLLQHAYSIVRAERVGRTAASLAELNERLSPARFTSDLDTILGAAAEGRVDKLYIDADAQIKGRLPSTTPSPRWNGAEEDLLNVAVVEAMLHGGFAFELPANKMPDGATISAVFRY